MIADRIHHALAFGFDMQPLGETENHGCNLINRLSGREVALGPASFELVDQVASHRTPRTGHEGGAQREYRLQRGVHVAANGGKRLHLGREVAEARTADDAFPRAERKDGLGGVRGNADDPLFDGFRAITARRSATHANRGPSESGEEDRASC